MVDEVKRIQTTVEREDNPKAVFYGQLEPVVTPLALYLAERSVDLYTGKELTDAFYGNYFFYVGDQLAVESFIAQQGNRLPKSLFLLTHVSEPFRYQEWVKEHPQIKVVLITPATMLTADQTEQILAFFFGAEERILELSPPVSVKIETPTPPLPPPAPTPIDASAETERAEPTKKPLVEVTAQIPAHPPPPSASERKNSLEFFFKKSPKSTGTLPSQPQSPRLPLFKASIVVLLGLLVFPLLTLLGELLLGGLHLYFASKNTHATNLASLERDLAGAGFFFRAAEYNLEAISPLFSLIRQTTTHRQLTRLIQVARRVSQGSLYLTAAIKDGDTLIGGISGQEKGVSFGQTLSAMKGNMTLADSELALAEADLTSASIRELIGGSSFTRIRQSYQTASTILGQMRQAVATVRNTLALVPEITGLYGTRTYLVVFQNNMELRPTGGFIGSYGLFRFADGVLEEVKVEDVYTADGALTGHVDPPDPIRVHLGQEHWYLRDANWDPDFTRSGARLAWFLDKEIEVAVDGVIAVDLTFIRELLQVTGPLSVADYGQRVTSENLFQVANAAAEEDFFPGSSQKKDFLGAVGRILIQKLLEERDVSYVTLLKKVHEGLTARNLLIYFVDPATQSLVDAYGWSGQLKPSTCPQASVCDFLAAVDANLGVNKANFFITRSFSDRVLISETAVSHELAITYKNEAKEESKLGGTYKNYVRIFVPGDSQLIESEFADLPLTLQEGNVASAGAMVQATEGEMRVFEGLVEVAPQKTGTLVLRYDRPLTAEFTGHTSYEYTIRKQPGTPEEQIAVTLQYPSSWQPLTAPSGGGEVSGVTTLEKGREISYNTLLSTDQVVSVDFRTQ